MCSGGPDCWHVVSRTTEAPAAHASTDRAPGSVLRHAPGSDRGGAATGPDPVRRLSPTSSAISTANRRLIEIQATCSAQTGLFVAMKELEDLVRRFDEAMIIEGPAFAISTSRTENRDGGPPRWRAAPTPRPSGRSAGPARTVLRGRRRRRPAGARTMARRRRGFRGILSPHIDFQRGGPVYTWSYKELVEQSHADTFVILGVAHQYCRRRFALTCKDFETPLGVVPTDRSYVDRIASLAGRDLFDDELSHRTEHSIEFQVVFLQYLLGGRRDFTIVPILVGSFHDLMERGIDPIEDPDVSRFIEALRAAEVGQRQESGLYRRDRPVPCRPGVRRPQPGRPEPPGAGASVRRRDARPGRGRRPRGLVPHGRRSGQPLAGLRPGRDLYLACTPSARHGAGCSSTSRPWTIAGPAA